MPPRTAKTARPRTHLTELDVTYLETKKAAFRRGNAAARASLREEAVKHILKERHLALDDEFAQEVIFMVAYFVFT